MRKYVMILLSIVGITFLLNSASEDKTNSLANLNVNTDTPVKALMIPTTEAYPELTFEEIASTSASTTFVSSYSNTSTKSSSAPNYTITRVGSDVAKNPENNIIRVNKLVYGHNSSKLLGSALNLSIGSIFTVTENGVSTTYKVGNVALFKKIDNYTLSLCANNNYEDCGHSTYYMNSIQNAYFKGQNYNIALFTCDGTNLGGGDATHRKAIFAYQV